MADDYEYFYQGAISSLQPEYGELFLGYRLPASSIGAPTSIQTADQLREVSSRLSEGVKAVELQPISPELFETIPKQHMREVNRLSKLTGSEMSVHAPIIDPAGFTQQGWNRVERERAEQRIWNVVERSHELNPEGNVPVVIHATGMPAAEYTPLTTPEAKETYEQLIKKGYSEQEARKTAEKGMLVAVNQDTGQIISARREREYFPEQKGAVVKTPEEKIKIINDTEWSNSVRPVLEHAKAAEDRLNEAGPALLTRVIPKIMKREPLSPEDTVVKSNWDKANFFAKHAYSEARTLYDRAYKYGDKETRRYLENFSNNFRKRLEEAEEAMYYKANPALLINCVNELANALDKVPYFSATRSAPQIFKPIEQFALDKSSKTFGDVAFKAYEKWGNKAPMINIENVHPEMAFGRAEELKKLIKKSRDEFVNQAIKKGFSSDGAREAAKSIIGATWDVGHINLMRKSGFGKKKIIEETKKIAPYVKHLHLTDNFGFEDSHLPPGMGEVPIKEMLKELEKAGFKGRGIVEAGAFVQHFKTSPHPYTLEAMGSPIYPAMMQPFWNQARGAYGAYFAGYGTMLPEQHFSMYGAGFSTLPTELGGQVPGKKSRLAGTPME